MAMTRPISEQATATASATKNCWCSFWERYKTIPN